MENLTLRRVRNQLKNSNKRRLMYLLKNKGKYLYFSEVNGYVYEVKLGEIDGVPVLLRLSLKSGKIRILSIGGESVNDERTSTKLG